MALTDNLVAWYDCDEGSAGDAVVDDHATFDLADNNTVGVDTTGGPNSQGVRDYESGSSHHSDRASSSDFQVGSTDFGAFVWARPESVVASYVWAKRLDWYLYCHTTPEWRWVVGYGSNSETTDPPTVNTWCCVQGWYDVSATTAYIQTNANSATSGTESDPSANTKDVVLCARDGGGNPFDGKVFGAAFWKGGFPTSGDRSDYYNSASGTDYASISGGAASVYPWYYYQMMSRGATEAEARHEARAFVHRRSRILLARRRDRLSFIKRDRWQRDEATGIYLPPASGIVTPRLFVGRAA